MSTTVSSKSATLAAMDNPAEKPQTTTRPWHTPNLPRIARIDRAAEIFGVHKSVIYGWLKPGSGSFPPDMTYLLPPRRLVGEGGEETGTQIWDERDLVEWGRMFGRKQAPNGQAVWLERRKRPADPDSLRKQIARLQAQLEAAEAKRAATNGGES